MQIVNGGAGSVVDEGKKRSKSATRSKPVQCFATDCGKQNGYRSSRKGFVAVMSAVPFFQSLNAQGFFFTSLMSFNHVGLSALIRCVISSIDCSFSFPPC